MNGRVQKTFQFARVHIFYAWCIVYFALSFVFRYIRSANTLFGARVEFADFDFASVIILLSTLCSASFLFHLRLALLSL